MGMRSNYGKEAAPADRNTLNRTTTTTTTTTNSTDAFSTLSAFNFVEQDPWSSTEHEGDIREAEPRISISSTVYSQSYYDPYDVLPTPRSAQTFQRTEPLDSMWRDSRERNNYSELEDRVSFMELLSPTENKPPVPTTPKPDFSSNRFSRKGRSSRSLERGMPNREQGRRSTPNKISAPGSRSNSYDNNNDPTNLHNMHSLTSNTLDPLSRADLVRKSKKLAQVFGQTPSGASLLPGSSSDPLRRSFLDINPSTSRHRPHNSIAVLRKTSSEEARERVKENVERVKGKGIWPPPPVTQYMSASSGRRYSTPLTPDEFDFLSELHRREPVSIPPTDVSSSILDLSGEDDSNLIDIGDANSDRQSFIDWGDDPSPKLVKGKGAHPVELLTRSPTNSQNSSRRSSVSSLAFAAPSSYAPRNSFVPQEEDLAIALAEAAPFDDAEDMERLARQPSIVSLSSPSLMSPEERAEAARRRKREKLAKLHRFLGSRVPTGLVLGEASEDSESGLPRPSASSMGEETDLEGSSEEKRSWKKGMARVTRRRSGSESGVSSDWSDIRDRRKEDLGEDERLRMVKRAVRLEKVFGVAPPQTLYHPRGHVPHAHSTSGLIAPPPKMFRSSSTGAVDGSSASSKKGRSRPNSRELLLPKDSVDEPERDVERVVVGRPRGASLVYAHYEHSLNSLGDILDRDDRASLKELHDILTGEKDEDLAAEFFPQPSQDLAGVDTDPPGYTSGYGSGGSTRSERRRSLPARTSMVSLASVASKASGGETDGDSGDGTFQARRRRAAKLTQFFGVDYRDLVRDVLDSIENGVELERGIGRIDRAEAEDLLRKLKTIKGKRASPLQV